MSRPNFVRLLRRAHEHLIASVGAVALTTLMLASVNADAHTNGHAARTPSVTILVPTVTIEAVAG
jgi:hypothetical protein